MKIFGLYNTRIPIIAGLAGATLAGAALAGVTNLDSWADASTQAAAKPAAQVEVATESVRNVVVKKAADNKRAEKKLLTGSTTASYFWDDASGRQGDTGMPASGKPMQKGLFSSPSWPLGTKGYVTYQGKRADFFIGDRGPGIPSSNGVMLDIDGKTFADLTGGTWNTDTLTISGNGGEGHINVHYVVTKWGTGPGRPGKPVPFSTGAGSE